MSTRCLFAVTICKSELIEEVVGKKSVALRYPHPNVPERVVHQKSRIKHKVSLVCSPARQYSLKPTRIKRGMRSEV